MKRAELGLTDEVLNTRMPPAAMLERELSVGTQIFREVPPRLRQLQARGLLEMALQAVTPADQPHRDKLIKDAAQPQLAHGMGAFVAQMRASQHPLQAQLDQLYARPDTQHLIENLTQGVQQAALWAQHGLSVYELTHSLAAAFILTEPPPFDAARFELPFPAFAIRLPEGFLPYWVEGEQRWTQLLFVHQFTVLDGSRVGQFTAYCDGHSLFRRHPWAELADDGADVNLMALEDDEALTDNDTTTMKFVARLVRNLIAWLEVGGEHASVRKSGLRRKGAASTRNDSTPTAPAVWELGRRVKLGRELRQMATELVLGRSASATPGWRVRMRHVVMGHWKMVAVGAGRLDRKRIHVAAYWRGPEGGEAWSHLYAASASGDEQ